MGRIVGFFLAILTFSYVLYRGRYPLLEAWLPISLLIFGGVGLVFALSFYWRYNGVFDYEETRLWGQTTNGKQARYILRIIGQIGFWLILMALFFYALNR